MCSSANIDRAARLGAGNDPIVANHRVRILDPDWLCAGALSDKDVLLDDRRAASAADDEERAAWARASARDRVAGELRT